MKTLLLIFWLGGAVAFWVSLLIALAEVVRRWREDFPDVKLKKVSRASHINTMIKLFVFSFLPILNWYLAWVYTFQFEEMVSKVLLSTRKEIAYDLQTDNGTNSENRGGVRVRQ